MAKPRVLVLRAPGINCDEETVFAWQTAGASVDLIHVNRLIERPELLAAYQVLTIPGGFSYGDDIAGGKILANKLDTHLHDAFGSFLDRGGILLGICNGFQVLLRMGLLPGPGADTAVTLTHNDSGRYEDRWVCVRAEAQHCPFLEPGRVYHLPVAHAEGKVVPAGGVEGARRLRAERRVALCYVAADGGPPNYPENPSGSVENLAGLVDSTGRVLGFMPHPERCLFNTPDRRRIGLFRADSGDPAECDGMAIFRRGVAALR